MAYQPEKDQTLWKTPENQEGLSLEVKSYDNGEPKVCFLKTNKYGTKPSYRISMSDINYMGQYWQQIKSIMESYTPQNPYSQQG